VGRNSSKGIIVSFKINIKNSVGSFKIKLESDLSKSEFTRVLSFAAEILNKKDELLSFYPVEGPVEGPKTQTYLSQSKLGEKPVSSIMLGDYKPPVGKGYVIKLLSMIQDGRAKTFSEFKKITGITLVGAKEIIFGNYPCPPLSLEQAKEVLAVFRNNNDPFAKIVEVDVGEAAA
jgi:hypothetical protein